MRCEGGCFVDELNVSSEPAVFKELPKEQQRALRKEFDKTTKAGRNMIIYVVVMAAVLIAVAVCGLLAENWVFTGGAFPMGFFVVLIAVNEDKFAKWLEAEKNIVLKRKKQK